MRPYSECLSYLWYEEVGNQQRAEVGGLGGEGEESQ